MTEQATPYGKTLQPQMTIKITSSLKPKIHPEISSTFPLGVDIEFHTRKKTISLNQMNCKTNRLTKQGIVQH